MRNLFVLAKGTMQVYMVKNVGKPAFTLAEVLVTLGIIGVVAAMTIPMLAKNYNFYIRQQQFKKVYASLNIAIQKTQIDMGEGVRCHYVKSGYNRKWITDCAWFYNELAYSLATINKCDGNAKIEGCLPSTLEGGNDTYGRVQGGEDSVEKNDWFNRICSGFSSDILFEDATVYVVNSGFIIAPFLYKTSTAMGTGSMAPLIMVDVNGHKGPNKWGHDVFIFELDKRKENDSVFYLNPSKQCHPIDVGGYYTTHFVEYLYGRDTNL